MHFPDFEALTNAQAFVTVWLTCLREDVYTKDYEDKTDFDKEHAKDVNELLESGL